jgi:DNA-binding transcriptional ArsR family regulator
MADMTFIEPERKVRFRFSPEPAHNALCSFCLLGENREGMSEWVAETKAKMTPEQREKNRALCEAAAYLDNRSWPSFPSWLDDLEKRDPRELVQSNLRKLLFKSRMYLGLHMELREAEELLRDRTAYISFCRDICSRADCEFHEKECVQEHEELLDPAPKQKRMVSHFRMMWKTFLEEEWRRVEPTLMDSVAAFESLKMGGESLKEALPRIIDREAVPETWNPLLSHIREVVFIPSAHIGPYLLLIDGDEHTARIVGRARIPAGATVRSAELSRSELLMRRSALGDESRLRILELISRAGESTTQDVMEKMHMSQSSASRHLSHLAATGYLMVRIAEGVKRFSLQSGRLDDTFQALKERLK